MTINSAIPQSAVRQPRGAIKINGVVVSGWISFEVDNNTFYQADTFRVTFAISMLPLAFNQAWFSVQTQIDVEIFAGFPVNAENYTVAELDSLILGRVDTIDFNPVSRTLDMSGRDYTSLMIDTKTTKKWQNMRASAIAAQIATAHGMDTRYIVNTTSRVGTYYDIDSVRMTNEHSEWDLLTWLAAHEGFVVYAKGNALHFEPKPSPTVEPYVLQWQEPDADRGYFQGNFVSIDFTRNLTVAKGVVVWVQSVNPKTKKTYAIAYPQAKAKGTMPGQSSTHAQVYTYRKAAMTPEKALQFAQEKHREITQHEMKLSASLPADNLLGVASIIKVVGTGTAFDQIYYPDSITRRMSVDEGYMMQVSAKNTNKDNEVTL